jgi:ABC-type hemin transport system ATPase subunit
MSEPRVVLDLSQHCVETAARREHARLQAALLDRGYEAETAGQLALVREFLDTVDFRKLRRDMPELAGGSPIRLQLVRQAGRLQWNVVDQRRSAP